MGQLEVLAAFALALAGGGALVAALAFAVAGALARGRAERRARRLRRCRTSALAGLGCAVALAGLVAWSQAAAHTPAIVDEGGAPVPGSIAELGQVQVNGRSEWVSIRGEDGGNPLLLFLAGGPGGSQLAAVRHDLGALERHFTVVVWEQPGSGKSFGAVDPAELTVETYVEDGVALAEHLLERFGQEKLYLVGESWGSALGVLMAERAPERFHAFVGTGQMVDFLETENLDYDAALAAARERGDAATAAQLEANGRPPYYGADVTAKSAAYLNYLSGLMASDPDIANPGFHTMRDIFSPEYGLLDRFNYLYGLLVTFNHVYPQLYGTDLREDVPALEVPVFFFEGRHDLNAPPALVEDYAAALEAPHKEVVWYERSGHSPWANESDRFVEELLRVRALCEEAPSA